MSIRITRTAIIPLWLIVFALIALVGPPVTSSATVFLLILWSVALAIVLVLWRDPPPTVAEVIQQVEASHVRTGSGERIEVRDVTRELM
jgi:hypothetical protein